MLCPFEPVYIVEMSNEDFATWGGDLGAITAARAACAEMGVASLTLYAFSSENWKRPQREVRALRVSWVDREEGWEHDRFLFTFDEWLYEVDIALAPGRLQGREARIWKRQLLGEGNLVLGQVAGMRPSEWYESVFTLDAELKYNILFSIGSSLAFVIAMLGLAWARLRTIDF
jgi:hypothetical protein